MAEFFDWTFGLIFKINLKQIPNLQVLAAAEI